MLATSSVSDHVLYFHTAIGFLHVQPLVPVGIDLLTGQSGQQGTRFV